MPTDILCTHSSLLSGLQRRFLQKQMGTDAMTRSQALSRERDLGPLSPKWDVSIEFLLSELRKPQERGEGTERV